ncbi:sperm flagellar protein 1-like [Perognathus longimembris pacificus]|uniref:sperm flagellar protein 1-like n=1 Tax=Perognathus longimembris pacificus TaxID=214514 RepID=UPI00201893C2|nr:sperm flagellar protein 1-like [Perognathus longimembris pacificus]
MPGAASPSPAALPPSSLHSLCAWLDSLPLSRPKRHLARDFSDGVLVAEIVKHFCPRLVDLHNYVPACSTDQKLSNWSLLNRKVFHKLHLCISEADIHKVVANTPGAIEPILCALRAKVDAGTVHDPGLSTVDAVQPWSAFATHTYTDLQNPPAMSSMKTFQNQTALERTDCCTGGGWDPAEGPWEHLARIQQQLEDKEQALAILQETVKILQMKVVRLEHLVQLKDLRIGELMRLVPEERQDRGTVRPKSARS